MSEKNKTIYWFPLFLVIRIILLFVVIEADEGNAIDGIIYITNDYGELLEPVDNLVDYGVYESVKGGGAYAGRMPGYPAFYLVPRLLFSKSVALSVLVLIQVVFSALSCFVLAKMIAEFCNLGKFAVPVIGGLYLIISYYTCWDLMTCPESLSVSMYIFGLFYFFNWIRGKKDSDLILSGVFITATGFLRPFLFPYFVVFVFIIIQVKYKEVGISWKIFRSLIIFTSFFIIAESAWITRNYNSLNKFIPLQTTFVPGSAESEYTGVSNYRPVMLELRSLISKWGGDNVHFYENSEMSFFLSQTDEQAFNFRFPSEVYDVGITHAELVEIRALIIEARDKSDSKEDIDRVDVEMSNKIAAMIKKIDEESGFEFVLISAVKRVKNLVYRNVVGNWPGPSFSESKWHYKGLKIVALLGYFVVLFLGGIGLVYFAFKRDVFMSLLVLNVLALLFLFAFVINIAEFKYFMVGFVNLFVIMIVFVCQLMKIIEQNKKRVELT